MKDFFNYPVKIGFTLAEVLITLMVIGTVSAMTIPSLYNDIQDMDNKVRYKQAYQILESVVALIKIDHGDDLSKVIGYTFGNCGPTAYYNDNDRDIIAEKVSFIKKYNSGSPVFPTIKYKNGTTYSSWLNSSSASELVLNNGMIFYITSTNWCIPGGGCGGGNVCTTILVDLNGSRGPNVYGRDIHIISIGKDGARAEFWNSSISVLQTNCKTYGDACGALWLQNGDVN